MRWLTQTLILTLPMRKRELRAAKEAMKTSLQMVLWHQGSSHQKPPLITISDKDSNPHLRDSEWERWSQWRVPSARAEEVVERANSGPTLPDDVCEIQDLGESSNQSPSEPESEPESVRELDVTAKESEEGKAARTRKRKTKYPCMSYGKPHRKGCRAVSQNVPVSQMHL